MISELFESNDDFDYIIAMDQSNVDDIQSINPNIKGKLFKLLEFSDMTETDVPDPYYTNNFEGVRSEEHTSELQSRFDLVCRLLLEKKKQVKKRKKKILTYIYI